MAEKVVLYNQVPKESKLRTDIKKLGPKDVVKYRLYGSFDPTTGKLSGASRFIPSTDIVMDPDTQEIYDIAYVTGYGEGGKPILGEIGIHDYHGFEVAVHGNNASEVKLYQYFEMCNYLAQNPHRDQSKPIFIERVEEDKDLAYNRQLRKKRAEALLTVESFSDEDVLNFIRANRLPDTGTPDSRRAKVEDYAEKNPDKFLNAPMIDYTSCEPMIDQAKKKKIISWNNVTQQWVRYDGVTLYQVKKGFGVRTKEELAKFLMSTDGQSAYEWLKEELAKK